MPRLRVVGSHAHALLGSGMKLVEKMCIHTSPSCHYEETRSGFAMKIEKLNSTQSNTARDAVQSGLRSAFKIHGNTEVVSQRIGAGDRNLRLAEGTDLLGPSRADGLVDGSHPNDLGFQWMAESLATRLRHLLAIS